MNADPVADAHVTRVTKDGKTYAIFVRSSMPVEDARFLTASEDVLQVGVFERPAGYEVKPHAHPEFDIPSKKFAEFLYIQKGKAKMTIFDENWEVIGMEVLGDGDFLMFLEGGHSVEVMEPTRMIEVKQGPYPGDAKAKHFRDSC